MSSTKTESPVNAARQKLIDDFDAVLFCTGATRPFDPTAKTVDELKKLNLPAGVDIQIKI